jgi:hypothetical protein
MANLGGLVFLQAILFAWLRVPEWEFASARDSSNDEDPKRFQFAIGDIVAGTTCVALLLGIVIRHPAPTHPSWYWSVLVLFWLVGPLIAACIVRSLLGQQDRQRQLADLAIAIGLMVASITGLAAAEIFLLSPGITLKPEVTRAVLALYGQLILGYGITFAVFPLAAVAQFATRTAERDLQPDT